MLFSLSDLLKAQHQALHTCFLFQFPMRESRIAKVHCYGQIISLSILVYQFYIFYSHLNSLQGILTIIYMNINNNNSLVIFNFISRYDITTSCCFHSLCKRTKLSLFNRALSFKLCFYGSQMVPFLWWVVDKV